MINEAEVRRHAAQAGVDPMVIDLDYSLGWFLLGFSKIEGFAGLLRFKGGTCLRKCYFPDYRFSEDLDFTLERFCSPDDVQSNLQRVMAWVTKNNGPDFGIQPMYFEVVDDEYGRESYQARLYYRGPLKWGGSPRTIRIDITRQEKLLLPAISKLIYHPYSDQGNFEDVKLPCYSLEEVMAEKVRAVGGQRRFAISRDIYDISNLLNSDINLEMVKKILPEKLETKGLNLGMLNLDHLNSRKDEFRKDWDHRLSYLVRGQASFDQVWIDVLSFFESMLQN